MPRSRYSIVLGRRYILIRPLTLLPAVAIDLVGYAVARVVGFLHRAFSRERRAKPVERVLAIRLDHIGDVLITTPALKLLRERFPAARLDVLAGSWSADLLRDDPDVDRVITFDAGWYGGQAGVGDLVRLLRRLRSERYNLVIDFRGDLRHLVLARLLGAGEVLGYGIRGGGFLLSREVPYDESVHEVDKAVALVRALCPEGRGRKDGDGHGGDGGDGDESRADAGGLQITVRAEDEARAADLFREAGVRGDRLAVALCPAARNPTRWWQGERFAEVARFLVERYGAQVLVFADPASEEVARPVLAAGLPGVHSLVGRTSLRVFAAALQRVDLIISVESSPIHFASALGKPIVTVFGGSSLPEQWGPYRTVHRIVHREVPCSPCHLLRCPLPRVLCMEAITADDVEGACAELLEELAARDPAVRAKLPSPLPAPAAGRI